MVGLGRLELPTPRLSSVCSNQLSYRPWEKSKHRFVFFARQTQCVVSATQSNSKTSNYLLRHIVMKNNLLWILTNRQSFVKEVIQPQVPLRLPCYDFTPVICHTVVSVLLAVRLPTSGATNSHGVTGGVYKARERIHRGILIRDY